ncbi:hypothetical protein D3C87_2034630 [compost metagenome]
MLLSHDRRLFDHILQFGFHRLGEDRIHREQYGQQLVIILFKSLGHLKLRVRHILLSHKISIVPRRDIVKSDRPGP